MAPHRQEEYEQDGFSETKRKYYRIIIFCVIIFGCILGLLTGAVILDVVRPVGEALTGSSIVVNSQVSSHSSEELKQTTINLCKVNQALRIYQLINPYDGLPTSLKILIESGHLRQKDIVDYWNQPFVYKAHVGDSSTEYELKSIGMDGLVDTQDDISISIL